MADKKIGLALGGGGAKGLAHIGVLKVLAREGIKINYLSGTSAGAVASVCWGLGYTISELEAEAKWLATPANWHELISFGNITKSIIGNDDLLKYLNRLFRYSNFDQLKIPVQVVTTDLLSGHEVLISSGNLAEAVMASSSIPGIFPPVKVDDKFLVDGGIVNQNPVSVVEAMGADVIIAVDLMLDDGQAVKETNLIETLIQSYELIRRQSVKYSLAKTKADYILIEPEFTGLVDTFKLNEAEKFIQAGVEATEVMLGDIKKRIGF